MKMESVKYTITCMILLLSSFVSSDRYSRLDKRINIIEEKVHFDATTFREDIADIFEMLDELLDKMPGDETFSEKAGSQTKYETKEIDKGLQAIKRAVQGEKKHIRKIIKEAITEISQNFSQQVNLTDTLRADLSDKVENISSSLKVLQAQIDKSKDEIHAIQSTYSDTQQEIAYVNKRLNRTTVEAKNVMQLNEKYDFLSKTIDCHNNFGYSFGNSCYFVEKDFLLTWAQANEKCENDGAYLTEIDNEEENTFLIKLASKLTPKDQLYGVWIGGSDLDYDGVWVWQKSKRLIYNTYSNFKGSEPNGKTQENCLHLIRKYYWNWNDYLCDTPLSYICERTL